VHTSACTCSVHELTQTTVNAETGPGSGASWHVKALLPYHWCQASFIFCLAAWERTNALLAADNNVDSSRAPHLVLPVASQIEPPATPTGMYTPCQNRTTCSRASVYVRRLSFASLYQMHCLHACTDMNALRIIRHTSIRSQFHSLTTMRRSRNVCCDTAMGSPNAASSESIAAVTAAQQFVIAIVGIKSSCTD
jgi:hypothetical protein